ncbi:YeiH family protein [Propionibacterium sp.]|uniref:YeiH family protein n=1 Tax=Propionibacterium sp. TaxID=1977903 RepID=UPI0039E82334
MWIGFGLVVFAIVLWLVGGTLNFFAPNFPKWASLGQLGTGLANRWPNLLALFVLYGLIFSVAVHFLRTSVRRFVAGFALLFALSIVIVLFSQWKPANQYNLEAPIVALVLGLIIGNATTIPAWFGTALRTELFVKVGVILLGATLPITLILKAGPVALLQASVIAVITFLVIYFVGVKLFHLDKRFAATLAAGGSICGVSASIAVGSSVKAKKEHVSASLSLVVVWAILAIFLLTAVSKALGLPNGVAGAWIGTSEFADAAGITAASSFGDAGIQAFTLVKVVGRDIFIGVWSLVLALIAVYIWDRNEDASVTQPEKVHKGQVWERFPKFVLGFFAASILLSLLYAISGTAHSAAIDKLVTAPLKELRTWAFTFTFLSIGITTRFRELTSVGWKPIATFSIGAAINILLGFALSAGLLGSYWATLGH